MFYDRLANKIADELLTFLLIAGCSKGRIIWGQGRGIAMRQGHDFDKSRYRLGMYWAFGTIPNYLSKGGGLSFPGVLGSGPLKGGFSPTLCPSAASLSLAHAGGTTIPNAYWVPAPVSLYDSQIHEPWGGPRRMYQLARAKAEQSEQDRR